MKTSPLLMLALATTSFALAQNNINQEVAHQIHLSEVVVTGSNASTSRDLMPYSVSRIGARTIETSAQTQLLSAISARVPSLFVSERNILGFGISTGGAGNIKIRGVGGQPTNAVLMMVDGQPQFSGVFSHPMADSYLPDYVERIEVLRGPASTLYGSNAMGGVVNIITRQVQHNNHLASEVKMQYGSYNTLLASATIDFRHSRFTTLANLIYNSTDGVQRNFDSHQPSAYVKLGFDISEKWRILADYRLMRFVGNDPIYPKLNNPLSEEIYHQNITRGEASVSLTNRHKHSNGNMRLYFSHGNHYVDDPLHFQSLDNRLGLLTYQNLELWRNNAITLGIDLDVYSGEIPISGGKEHTDGSLATLAQKEISEFSPYLTVSQSFADGKLVINGGLRIANSSIFTTELVPQIGAVWHLRNQWRLKTAVAKGYRNPSFKELYLYRMANANLEPEKMINYELTSQHTLGTWGEVEVTAFFADGKEMIQTINQQNENVGEFQNKGIEVSAAAQPTNWLRIDMAYSYLHTSSQNLTGAPRNIATVSAAAQPTSKLSIDTNLRFIEGLYISPQHPPQSYALLNMCAQYQVNQHITFLLNAANLTNTHYEINRGYQMPGTNLHAGVKIKF